jgi:hypothetical protein
LDIEHASPRIACGQQAWLGNQCFKPVKVTADLTSGGTASSKQNEKGGSGSGPLPGSGGLRHQQLASAVNHTLTMDFHASSLAADRKRASLTLSRLSKPLYRYDGVLWLEPVSSSAAGTPNIDDHSHGAVHGNLEGMQHAPSCPDGRHVFDLDSKGTDLIVEKKQSSVDAKLFSKFLGRESPAPRR